MKRRKEEEGGGQEWLNTYADMITLVLTFFVLLYSISNVNITKLEQIAAAMQKKLGMEQASRFYMVVGSTPFAIAVELSPAAIRIITGIGSGRITFHFRRRTLPKHTIGTVPAETVLVRFQIS